MTEEAIQALRQVIFHKLKMWDASLKAEEALGVDIDTSTPDGFAASINEAEDALSLSEQDLTEAFQLKEVKDAVANNP